jgi:hypothetical protein
MEVFDAFRHPVSCSRTSRADLKNASVHLHVECQDVAAQIGDDAMRHERV